MKQIIKIQEQYGTELHTRQMMERLAASLNPGNAYLLDMRGVEQISRSAADELYNLTHSTMQVVSYPANIPPPTSPSSIAQPSAM